MCVYIVEKGCGRLRVQFRKVGRNAKYGKPWELLLVIEKEQKGRFVFSMIVGNRFEFDMEFIFYSTSFQSRETCMFPVFLKESN